LIEGGPSEVGRRRGPDQVEDRRQRVNRELSELLSELRVALPGVQVLFGFLLAAVFQPRFTDLGPALRVAFLATLIFSALSIVLLIAPAAQHRLLFRKWDKEPMLFRFNRFAVAGLLCLGIALCGAVLVIVGYAFGLWAGVVAAAMAAVLVGFFWVVVPLRYRRAGEDHL
jgi:amino acid transporter